MSFNEFLELFLHLDTHLDRLVETTGGWTYAIVGAIVFAETGFVVLPFLPGDSLLFALGAVAARGSLNIWALLGFLTLAAIAGNLVNYSIGRYVGRRVEGAKRIPFISQRHLERTHAFFERHGAKAVVISRFVPIIRTVAPFVAGLGAMPVRRFVFYTVAGGAGWVVSCVLAGVLFGNIPIVRDHFSLVVIAIVVISLIPAVVEVIRSRMSKGD